MIWNILWYILLPFIAIFDILKKITKNMSETQVFFFIILLIVVILQITEVITNL